MHFWIRTDLVDPLFGSAPGSGMGVETRDIRPYAVTVYEPDGLIIDRVITALQGQAEANGGVLLYSHNASVENLAHFMKSKFVLNERELIVRDIDLTEATIIPRNSEVDYYVSYKDMLDDIISPLAFEKRRLLNLTPGERFMRRCKPGIMITLSGARKAEMGFEPSPTGHGYPERAYELIAQTVAEIVSKGYPGMPVAKEEKAKRGSNAVGKGKGRRGRAVRLHHSRQRHQGHRSETLEVRRGGYGHNSEERNRRPISGGSDYFRQTECSPRT